MKRISLFAFFACCALAVSAQRVYVQNSAVQRRYNTPVYVTLDKPLPAGDYQLTNITNHRIGKVLPAQLADSVTLVFITEKPMPPAALGVYDLKPAKRKFKSKIKVQQQPNGLLVSIDEKPLLFYHTKDAMPPVDSPAYYRRSGFIHPLYSPSGSILTDDFPADHAHQHGIFMTWVNTTFRGQFLDFWNQHKKTGTVEHVEVISIK